MIRIDSYLDRLIGFGLTFVLVFTPLAFGAVEDWAKSTAQLVIMVVFLAWALRRIWAPAPSSTDVAGSNPRGAPGLTGLRLRWSGLEAPALLFTLVVCIQLLPLPPSLLRVVSPRTAEIYAQSLPGYGVVDQPTFANLSRWLEESSDPEAGGVPVLPPNEDIDALVFPSEVFERTHPAWRPLSTNPASTRRALQVFLAHFALFLVVFNGVDRGTQTMRYLYVLAGLAGLLALLAIAQELTGTDRLYWWRSTGSDSPPFGPFVSRNNFAGWMEMLVPVCAGLGAVVWHRHKHRDRFVLPATETSGMLPVLLLLGFCTVFGLSAFIYARSRGGLLSLAVATGIYSLIVLLRERPRRRPVVVLVVIIGAAVGLAAWIGGAELWARYETLGDIGSEPSFRFRLAATAHTLGMARDFPLFGTGFGTFEQVFSLYAPGTSHKALARTHNDYAQLAAECGLIGLLAMAWGLFVLIRRAVAPGLSRNESPSCWPIRGAAVGVLALLLHSFVDFNLQIYSNSLLFVFLCAILLQAAADGSPGSLDSRRLARARRQLNEQGRR